MATIIDALLVTLGLDNSEFKKGTDETIKDQERLRQESGKTAQDMQAQGKNASEFFTGLTAAAGALLVALGGIAAFKGFASGMLEAEDSGLKLSNMLNVNIEDLQAWERSVALEGGTTESFDQSLKGLNARIVGIAEGLPRAEQSLKVFASLGISEATLRGKDAIGVMGLLSEKFEGMSGGKALALGERLGLDEGTIRLLLKGKDAIADMVNEQKALGVYTREEAEAAEVFNDTMDNANTALSSVGRSILTALMPALQMLADGLTAVGKWAKEHPDTIRVIFVGIATAIGLATAAMMAFTAASLVNPVVLILTAIIALIAAVAAGITWVYNEWKKWTDGGESSLGKLFKFFTDGWNAIKGTVVVVIDYLKYIISNWIDAIVAYFELFWGILTGDGAAVEAAFKKLTTAIGNMFSMVWKMIQFEFYLAVFAIERAWNENWDKMKAKAAEVIRDIKEWMKDMTPGGAMGFALNPGGAMAYRGLQKFVQNREAGRQAAMASGPVDNSQSREVHIGAIAVHTNATDAQGVAGAIGGAIVDQSDTGMWG